MRIGLIGGTGIYDLGKAVAMSPRQVETPYGAVEVSAGEHAGHELLFLPRHRADHSVPPHRINYRANVDALRREACDCIIATNAVGSIRRDMQPGDLVLPDQFLDFTRSRPSTFYEGGGSGVRHVDVTEPYCPALRIKAAALLHGKVEAIHPAATYVCTEGPRFETPAEIRMFEMLGADVVGMTGVPEVVLAREAGLCYLSVCVVTNFAAGISAEPLTEGEVKELMSVKLPFVQDFVLRIVEGLDETWTCGCRI